MNELLASKEDFERLKTIKAGTISNDQLKRQIDILYLLYLGKQGRCRASHRMSSKPTRSRRHSTLIRAPVASQVAYRQPGPRCASEESKTARNAGKFGKATAVGAKDRRRFARCADAE